MCAYVFRTVRACMCVCLIASMCVHMSLSLCVCVFVVAHAHTQVCIRKRACVRINVSVLTHSPLAPPFPPLPQQVMERPGDKNQCPAFRDSIFMKWLWMNHTKLWGRGGGCMGVECAPCTPLPAITPPDLFIGHREHVFMPEIFTSFHHKVEAIFLHRICFHPCLFISIRFLL